MEQAIKAAIQLSEAEEQAIPVNAALLELKAKRAALHQQALTARAALLEACEGNQKLALAILLDVQVAKEKQRETDGAQVYPNRGV